MPIKTPLAKAQGVSPLSDDELERKRQRAYNEQDIYIFTPEQREKFTFTERLQLEAFAIRLYGRRK
jgi:hypothetical protein